MTDTADWTALSAPEMVDHLEETHHEYLKAALPSLGTLVESVQARHADDHPELVDVAAVFRELRADLEPHLMKEEQILFPMVRELFASESLPQFHCGSLQNPIRVMEFEHDRAGTLLARLRSLTSVFTPPSEADDDWVALYAGLAELETDTLLHIRKENDTLFPAVVVEELRRGRS